MKNKTTVFIENAILIHGDRFDYSLVNYEKSNKNISIICSRHGVFQQTPAYHQNGGVCPYCARNRYTRDEFLQVVKELHGKAYDYSKCNYSQDTRKSDYITITCKKHGDFRQRLDSHLRGSGCPLCAMQYRPTKKVVLQSSRFNNRNYIKRTGPNTCTISFGYMQGVSPTKQPRKSFKNYTVSDNKTET